MHLRVQRGIELGLENNPNFFFKFIFIYNKHKI